MISAPSEMACWAPACAPCGVPPSSLTRSWTFGLLNSARAISAAFFIDCAATPPNCCVVHAASTTAVAATDRAERTQSDANASTFFLCDDHDNPDMAESLSDELMSVVTGIALKVKGMKKSMKLCR